MKCDYCGEEEGTERIVNPNGIMEEKSAWNVCKVCKEVIKQQQALTFGSILNDMKGDFSKEYGEKVMDKANKELDKIAKRTKKPIMNACIYKKKNNKYGVTSVEFKGDKK